MVFNATFNNISVISWQSVLLVEETGGPGENHWPSQVTDKLYHIMLYTSPLSKFELTTSVVIGTDCIGSCKSNYHTIMATTAPLYLGWYSYSWPFIEILHVKLINGKLMSKQSAIKKIIIPQAGYHWTIRNTFNINRILEKKKSLIKENFLGANFLIRELNLTVIINLYYRKLLREVVHTKLTI